MAILSVVGGIIFYFILKGGPPEAVKAAPIFLGMNLVLAALFAGLAVWARFNPLPAAIVGLVLFLTIHVVSAIVDPASILQGVIVKVIVIVVLAKAIQAGVRYKQLREQMTA